MRVAVYVRVSTSHQVQQQTIEQQLARLRNYVQSQGWLLSEDDIYRDDGYSGATLVCPGLDRLRNKGRNRELDRLLLTTPDRLARNYVHQMVLIEELNQLGCQVEFLDRPMSDDPHDHIRTRPVTQPASPWTLPKPRSWPSCLPPICSQRCPWPNSPSA